MNRVLIHSEDDAVLAEKMKLFMETRLPYSVGFTHDRVVLQGSIAKKPVHLIVFETKVFTETDMRFLIDLRSEGFHHPFLIVSESLKVQNFLVNVEQLKAHYLPKPFEFKALRGITQKLVATRAVPQQMHRRFRTEQPARLETFTSSESHVTEFYNLSVGGAYVEFADSKPRLGIGDLIRFRVNLEDVDREHAVNARVVWTTRKGMHHGGFGCGVRFVKAGDIYRQLMDR